MFQHLVSLTEIENNDMIQLCLSHMYFTQALKTKDNYNNLREKSIDYAKLDLAIDWLLKSADQNCVEAQITLGMSIIENKINSFFPIPGFLTDMIQDESLHSMRWTSIPADYIQKIKLKALEHLNKAALQNNIFAQYWMGRIHYDKHEMDSSNYNAALPWFQKSFEGGYLYAGLYLSEMYAKGLGCDSNHEQSVEIIQGIIYWLKNETHSFSEAVTQRCKTLSSNFLIDIAIKQYEAVKYQPETNKAELSAWKLLDILADCNCLDAAAQRAHCYARGIYVEQNIDKAATLGDIDSQLQLAERYIHGIGVEKNVLTALAWYEKAADQGNAEARYQAAYWHMQNRSTRSETEDGEAVERLFHAVIQEHPLATEWFMDSCLKFVFPYIHASKNSEQGYRFAFDWLTQKAQEYHENGTHDDYMIHYGLGILYTFGKGIKKNHELAKNHLRKSIDLLPSDHNSFNFCDLVWAVGATCLSIIYNTTKIAIDEKEFFNIIETDYWVFICLGCVFSSVKKDTDIEIKKILPFLEFNYHISHSNYDLAEQVLKKDFSIHLDRDLPLENSFKSMGLLALKEIKSLEKAHQALREKEKEMLSFFTHTMRNALATAPESLRQAISLLGNEVYEKDINHYKAINKIASLFSTLSLTDCLIDTFKQSISEPE
jgi:TPR repeat protein